MKKLFAIVMMFAVAMMMACGSADKKGTGDAVKNEFEGAPKWVLGSSSTATQICGVGSAAGSRNVSMMRTTAIGRGRTEIARMLELKVQSMLKDYQSTTTGGEEFGKAANDEQHIVDVAKQITDLTLSGTEQKESWISDSGTIYILMCADLEKFKNTVSSMSQLSESVRKAVAERADKAFDELSKEIENSRKNNQ
ncbi:LPP20 family lipoprotein [bacterium]|nr:LPP20 family lipoprotein [bacterium]